jgi:hypothetical protein
MTPGMSFTAVSHTVSGSIASYSCASRLRIPTTCLVSGNLAYQLEQALYRQESHPLEIVIAAVLPPSKQNDLVAKLEKVE